MAERTVAQLLREAATALDEQRGVGSATNMPAPDRTGEGRANRGEVVRMFRPYQAPHQRRPHPPRRTPKTQSFTHRFFCLTGRRQEEVPNPSERFLLERAGLREKKITFPDKFCTATEFTAILLLNYPALRDCGGYQLLRARGTTRSKCLIPIDCPREGYTPHYLCSTANIGQAILYARPLQRDIDLETISQTEEPGPHTQCEVECMFCGQVINMASIQDHIDVCEISHQQSTSAAQTSAQSSAAQSSAQSAAQSAAPTSASQSAAPTSAAQSSAQSSAPTSAAQSSAQSSASTSAAQSSAQSSASTSAAQSSAQSSASTSAAQSSASTSAAQTSAASTSSTGRVSDICNEEWKLEPDTKAAAKMFQTHLLKDADQKPTLMLTLDMHVTEEDRERAIIGFYKQTNIDWTRPFEVQLKGDCAIGDGVKKYFFSLCLNKLQTGLNLHLNRPKFTPCKDMGAIDAAVLQLDDCPDLDIVEIVSLLESQTVLTPENVDQVNHLALSWDLPNLTENNRRLLGQQILHHGVIVRRERQMAQLRKGLKDTRVLQMLKERPELASALFPRSAEAELEPEMIIERIVWPEPDSDEEEEIDEYCSVVAYLRQYISLASSSELQQLIEFWTGWAVLPDELYVSVDRDATYPTASTCFTTLKIPTGCGSYRDFCFKLGAAVSTTKFGFGRI
ncbi:unnamed protein product [Boreogadus saida]